MNFNFHIYSSVVKFWVACTNRYTFNNNIFTYALAISNSLLNKKKSVIIPKEKNNQYVKRLKD